VIAPSSALPMIASSELSTIAARRDRSSSAFFRSVTSRAAAKTPATAPASSR
jgi:hypothetical protein